LNEKRISSEPIYSGRVINLRVDKIAMEDGRVATREVIEHHGAVGIVPVMDDGRVILVRQFRYAVGEDLLEIPAGTLHPGEEPAACAARELVEETNHQATRIEKILFTYLAPGYSNEGMHYYLATGLQPCEGQQDEDEHVEIEIVTMADALGMIENGNVRDAKSVAGLLVARERLEHRL